MITESDTEWKSVIIALIIGIAVIGTICYSFLNIVMMPTIPETSKIIRGDLPDCDPTLKATEGYEYYCNIKNVTMWCNVEYQNDEHLKNVPMCEQVYLG